MDFYEVLDRVVALLQQRERVTYRALKRQFDLDDEYLNDLKDELVKAQQVARDENGEILVWVGDRDQTDGQQPPTLKPAKRRAKSPKRTGTNPKKAPGARRRAAEPRAPVTYTPPHLAERLRVELAAMEARGSSDGERKVVTHLFSDLKGSTALIEGLDPEEARSIIDPALQIMMDAVHRYDGYVAQALGDGIFALFGAPIAHEDHPQRALYAALLMQEQMRRYSDELREKGLAPLFMRVGVNTGEVVVRSIHKEDLQTDYVPVGRSTNIAARMEQIAAPGSILVSEGTHKLTAGYFEFKSLGKTQVKGVEEPLNVYEVLGAGPLRTRLQVAARRGLTHFVGRQSELEQVKRALEQAKAGHGQIVGVMGEAGVGKSRLFYEFKLTSLSGCLVLEAFSVSHGKASPYLPIIELLKHYFQIEPADDERTRKEKINGKVLTLDRSLEDIVLYLFSLLGIDDPHSSLQQMDPQIRRRRTFEALKKLFLRESLNQPLILIFEDLHWIDTETQGFLDMLSESVASAKLLLLVNYRPEYRPEWGQKTYYMQLRLAPLGKAEAEELLTFLLGNDASLTALKHLILEKTDGTPFFMEEVVQTLVEEGTLVGDRGHYRLEQTPTELHLSPTVQGVLAARIDRLPADEKAVLQQLAVMGRQFPVRLVQHVVSYVEADLYRLLAALQAKEFLYEQPAFPESAYLFKHALTQEVAYNTVLQEQRKVLHERTGQALETLYTEKREDYSSDLAHHYRLSGNAQKAVEYLQLAGQQAVQRSANEEAVRHFTTALELLQPLPDAPERRQHELILHVALGVPLSATKSWAAPEVETVYQRARELCEEVGDTPELFPVLWGLWVFYAVRAEHKRAHELGEQFLRLAHSQHDPALLVEAHAALGAVLYILGEFLPARTHLEQEIALYDAPQHHALAFRYGSYDPGVTCLSFAAEDLWQLGYPEQGLKRSHEALGLAQALSHPFSLAFALNLAARFHQLRREGPAVQDRAEAAIALSTEQGFPFLWAWGTIMRGWALAEHGQGAEGLAHIREGLAAYQATGAEVNRPYFLALLAEVLGKVGQAEAGLRGVEEALTLVSRTEEGFAEAELYRLKGELLWQHAPDQQSEAAVCFQHALAVARQQQAKSWELRAATSLARLWQSQGKTTEAHELLAPVHEWFTEGCDTADLQHAKALLAELAEGA